MAIFVSGLIGIGVFYLLILIIGIWAGRKAKNQSEDEMLLAGRNIGVVIGTLTLIATWVSGSYVNGTAEAMFKSGLLWAQVPIGYSISLFVGGIFFVKPMRDLNCVTLLDPFQRKYGSKVGSLLLLPCIIGDFFWVGSVLNALGSSLALVTDLDPTISVIISTSIVAAYTSMGAMYSVTYTDVVQLFLVMAGLVLSAIFATHSPVVNLAVLKNTDWLGTLDVQDAWRWADTMALLIMGGIPWQGYFQRVLAISSTKAAQTLSIISMFGCMILSIPPAFLGILARTADWSLIPSLSKNVTTDEANIILPLVLRHLTPQWVSFFGLGAISAVAMSSADSSILAFGSLFTKNIYKELFRQKCSEREMVWVLRGSVLIISTFGAIIALTLPSIYYMSIVSGDLLYVILFPQLLLVLYWNKGCNSYGCITSFFVGLILRILGGEPGVGIPVVIKYPGYDSDTGIQYFPQRTFAMIVVMSTHVVISCLARFLFKKGYLPLHYDVLQVFPENENDIETVSSKKPHNCETAFNT